MSKDLYTLQDPTTQYHPASFEHQQQPVPGLEQNMQPRAIGGEISV